MMVENNKNNQYHYYVKHTMINSILCLDKIYAEYVPLNVKHRFENNLSKILKNSQKFVLL